MAQNTKPTRSLRTKSIIDWSIQFDRVVKYSFTKFGYSVVIKDNIELGEINFTKLIIKIKTIYKNKEFMTYLLLHELGHIIQAQKVKLYKRRIQEVHEVVSKSSLSFRTTVLYEEMDAWNEAYDLAKKLRLPIDRKKFETYKSRCLKTYMIWAINTNQKQTLPSIIESPNIDNIHYEVILSDNNEDEDEDDNRKKSNYSPNIEKDKN